MIVIGCELVAPTRDSQRSLNSALKGFFGPEFSEFNGFGDDLGAMTEPWQAAFHDLSAYLGDLDEAKP